MTYKPIMNYRDDKNLQILLAGKPENFLFLTTKDNIFKHGYCYEELKKVAKNTTNHNIFKQQY